MRQDRTGGLSSVILQRAERDRGIQRRRRRSLQQARRVEFSPYGRRRVPRSAPRRRGLPEDDDEGVRHRRKPLMKVIFAAPLGPARRTRVGIVAKGIAATP